MLSASAAIANAKKDIRSVNGETVAALRFEGVPAAELAPLPDTLALRPGAPFRQEDLRTSLRQLFATGLYQDITAKYLEQDGKLVIIFQGTPQLFVHRVYVEGPKQEMLAAQLQRATRLEIGTPLTQQSLGNATKGLRSALQQSGHYRPKIDVATRPAQAKNQVDVVFTVNLGEQAKVGNVTVTGDPGMSLPQFRKAAKAKAGAKIQADTLSRSLEQLRKHYQKKDRLEATVKGNEQPVSTAKDTVDLHYSVDQGPLVRISTTGAHVSSGTLRRLVPIYEEGAVDPDLLNEADRNLRDHFQRQGYFDVSVTHAVSHPRPGVDSVLFRIERGPRRKVVSVQVDGNHYFDTALIKERLSVVRANAVERYGLFSQSMLNNDAASIAALYKSNGFAHVKIVPHVTDVAGRQTSGVAKVPGIHVEYQITEGPQQRVGKVQLNGVHQLPYADLARQISTSAGQPFSLYGLAGDRTAILTEYYRHGFLQVQMSVTQQPEKQDPDLVDIDFNIDEGKQFFVNRVLTSGVDHTRPQVVQQQVQLAPGGPLDRSALQDTQRHLYDLALFSEVDTAVVNPHGEQQKKDVLINLSEAHRWNYDYGFGLEVQTGTPQKGCLSLASQIQLGIVSTYHCSPNGKFGASPRVSFDISRINLRGTPQSITLQTAYGTLEKQANLVYEDPRVMGHPTLNFSLAGGYDNSQDITTYESTSIYGTVRLAQRPTRADTLMYTFTYRYVYVNPNSLEISANLIPIESQPALVSGPGVTWVHDTRDDPLNATRGWYLSAQQFLSWHGFGARAVTSVVNSTLPGASTTSGTQVNFNRIDVTQANYYRINRQNWILARSTRFGFENSYGGPSNGSIPLPERLYAGGATSHRGFSINSAGPRDLQTGYPVGGNGAFVNSTELRIPPIALPWIGNNMGFAIFNDMGNVYETVNDMWSGIFRVRQPNRSTCYNVSGTTGTCNFNYNSQAVGVGLRYKTPVGPVRLDFSDNLNPTYYPVIESYSGLPPYVGNSGHFNFFFSMGQAF